MWTSWQRKVRPEKVFHIYGILWNGRTVAPVLGAFLILMVACMSCEEYQEGCMDANATNFRVSNQIPCCCEYPKLIFQTTITKDSVTRSFADTFTNSYGQRYLIREFRFMATGITLTDSLDVSYHLTDTFGQHIISPDILAVDVLNLNSEGSNFMRNGRFDGLHFSIDRPEELAGRAPADFPVDHPLRDSMFYDFSRSEWIAARVIVDIPDQDQITIDLAEKDLPVPVLISGDWTKTRGNNLTVNYKINVETLFGNMDFTMPEPELVSLFAANLSDSFEP